MFENLFCEICIILEAFWKYKIDKKGLLRVELSQIEGKLKKHNLGINWTFSPTHLRTIYSNFGETDVYALFQQSFRKICDMIVLNKGGAGGGQGSFKQCKKKQIIWCWSSSLTFISIKFNRFVPGGILFWATSTVQNIFDFIHLLFFLISKQKFWQVETDKT